MARYVVKFFKYVVGENGAAESSCQDAFEIEGRTPLEAAELGKAKFCERGHLQHWTLHADRYRVDEAEPPRRQ